MVGLAQLPQWFSNRRSLANGISAAGALFGGLAYSFSHQLDAGRLGLDGIDGGREDCSNSGGVSRLFMYSSAAHISLRQGLHHFQQGSALTFRILAICAFIPNLIAIILLLDRNNVQQPKRLEIWLVVGWGCLSELGYTVQLYSLPNYARRVGLNAHQGSILGALINLGLLIGRPLTGYLSDTWGRINLATLTTGLCGVACLVVWIFSKSFGSLCFFAIVTGIPCGTFWASVAPVGADVAGHSEVPSILSVVLFYMTVLTTCRRHITMSMSTFGLTPLCIVAEPIGLAMRRSTGDIYLDVQIFTGFMFIGASNCNLFLRGWKLRKTEEEAANKRQHEHELEGRGEQQSRLAWMNRRAVTVP